LEIFDEKFVKFLLFVIDLELIFELIFQLSHIFFSTPGNFLLAFQLGRLFRSFLFCRFVILFIFASFSTLCAITISVLMPI